MDNGNMPNDWMCPDYTEEDSQKAWKKMSDDNFDMRGDIYILGKIIKDFMGQTVNHNMILYKWRSGIEKASVKSSFAVNDENVKKLLRAIND